VVLETFVAADTRGVAAAFLFVNPDLRLTEIARRELLLGSRETPLPSKDVAVGCEAPVNGITAIFLVRDLITPTLSTQDFSSSDDGHTHQQDEKLHQTMPFVEVTATLTPDGLSLMEPSGAVVDSSSSAMSEVSKAPCPARAKYFRQEVIDNAFIYTKLSLNPQAYRSTLIMR